MLDIEHALVKNYGWSLYDIDQTDIDSLLPFLFHKPGESEQNRPTQRAYCDQVNWL